MNKRLISENAPKLKINELSLTHAHRNIEDSKGRIDELYKELSLKEVEIKVLSSKYELLKEDYSALQLSRLKQGETINVERDSTRGGNPDSMFDKAKAKHGFSLYDKAKDKISIEFLESKVARLDDLNQDLEKKNREQYHDIDRYKADLEYKAHEYSRLIARDAEIEGMRDLPNRR